MLHARLMPRLMKEDAGVLPFAISEEFERKPSSAIAIAVTAAILIPTRTIRMFSSEAKPLLSRFMAVYHRLK
jgi:hypothetical protein